VELLFPLIDALPVQLAEGARDATFAGLGGVTGSRWKPSPPSMPPPRPLRCPGADLVIVARFSHLFDRASIAVPRHGILNVHPGRLPELAGLHAPLRAVIGADALWLQHPLDHSRH
jgi:hypothetical protein